MMRRARGALLSFLVLLLLAWPTVASSGAPTFHKGGVVAPSNIVFGAGEPSLSAGRDGRLWLSFPGCEASALTDKALGRSCANGPVYDSMDAGTSWHRWNGANGALATGAPSANGDADVAVDAAGNAYAADLGSNVIQVFRLPANASAWQYMGNVVPANGWSDRQWLAAAESGHFIVGWMGGAASADRQVALRASFDGGVTFSPTTYVGSGIGWIGTLAFSPLSTQTAYVVYSQHNGSATGALAYKFQDLWVAKSTDGGLSWSTRDTGIRVQVPGDEDQWSGVLMAPALAVTGTGRVVLAWSEYVPGPDPTGSTSISTAPTLGAVVKLASSTDGGASWSAPLALTALPTTAIMPWIAAGAGDRVGVSYYASPLPMNPNRVGEWSVVVTMADLSLAAPTLASAVVDADVHQGGICTQGGACLVMGEDRALLDFFKSAALPDGRMVIAYPADPLTGGKATEIRFAIQDGGDLLN